MPVRTAEDDDGLDELPPLDGGAGDAPEPETGTDDLPEGAGEGASLDDRTAEDEPPDASEIDLRGGESGWLEGTNEAKDLDMGEVALLEFAENPGALDDLDELGVGDEDFGLREEQERGGLDMGDEGPLDDDEELREADLPALDADDEGDVDDAALIDPGFGEEPLGVPWAERPWPRVGAPIGLTRGRAIACAARGALVAACSDAGVAELLRVDLEGTCERLGAEGLEPAEVKALATQGRSIVAVEGARLLVSNDSGGHFSPVAAAGAPDVIDRLAPDSAATIGALLGITAKGPAAADAADGLVVTRGEHLAYVARSGNVVVRQAPGGASERLTGGGRVTALAFVDDAGTLLTATYFEPDDTTALVRLDVAGDASVVARVGGSRGAAGNDGRVLAMALDEARGVVWLAGGFGIAAFAVS